MSIEHEESGAYKIKLVRDAHIEAIRAQHEDPIANNPWVARRPYDRFTESQIEYTTRVLGAMRMERDQTFFRLKQLDDGIAQAELYLDSIVPPEDPRVA